MMLGKAPIIKDLVLLGGGHTHIEVLRSFGMKPLPGVRLTLITRDMHTPYSGMLPGFISGFYSYDDCHIDLSRLANFAKARLIHAEASGIDTEARQILFPQRPPLEYDVLSINIGVTPSTAAVPGAQQYATAVKPIDKFAVKLDALFQRYRSESTRRTAPMRIAVVGGGAGGIEVCLSLRYRLEQERQAANLPPSMKAHVTLVSGGTLLESQHSWSRAALLRALREQGVELVERDRAVSVGPGSLELVSGRVLPWDECIWCTGASAPGWLAASGLPTDPRGFLSIGETLQCSSFPAAAGAAASHPAEEGGGHAALFSAGEVFAAGDVASCAAHPRPKAGVFAVRQGPPLQRNLRCYLLGQPLEPFIPQTTNLSLITTGDRHCVGTKGWLSLEGSWLWAWKDNIDRTFMRKYSDDLAVMEAKMMGSAVQAGGGTAPAPRWRPWAGTQDGGSSTAVLPGLSVYSAAGPEGLALLAESKMRCGGCGAKVGSSVLSRVLSRLQSRRRQSPSSGVVIGLDTPDDAALVRPPPPGHLLLHTVDFFRSFWADPFVFGRIAATHALGDCYAMGGTPRTALAVCVVAFAAESKVEGELTQMMAGAVEVLDAAGCELVGGHTCEGEEMALGFTINGDVPEAQVLGKGGLRGGQVLLLTKALGTGTVMAAAMKGLAKGRWVATALSSMQQSSGQAVQIAQAHGCTACTDVTGFGLLGHVVEMARASKVHVQLSLDAVPVLPGALYCLGAGALSSLHRQNVAAVAAVTNAEELTASSSSSSSSSSWPILVDPQTSGGMLLGVPAAEAEACLQELREAGYTDAAAVGKVLEPGLGAEDGGGTGSVGRSSTGACVTMTKQL